MKLKKSKKADLEKKRFFFFQIGLIASIALVLAAFEWSSPGNAGAMDLYASIGNGEDIIEVPVTKPKETVEVKKIPHFLDDLKIAKPGDPEPIDVGFITPDSALSWAEKFKIKNTDEENVEGDPIVNPSEKPVFSKGDFSKYIAEHIDFPATAEDLNMKGKVTAKFVIDKNGKLTNIEILKSTHPIFSEAVIEVLEKSPDWTPGKQYGRPVKVLMSMPFVFDLRR
ncbi:MAG: TonB family protein [Bacteroidales bacterium]|nr:TonB family protein [Bacteroidales bacterium]